MTRKSRWLLRLSVAALAAPVVLLDQITKVMAVAILQPGVPRPVVGDLVSLTLARNPGAAFSFATGATVIFTFLAAAALAVAVVISNRVAVRHQRIALALAMGGVAGNLLDRVLRTPGNLGGHVVDFISVGRWPIFNIADSALCVAAAMIVIGGFRSGRSEETTNALQESSKQSGEDATK